MKITMKREDLQTVFDACKNFVSKEDYRPIFQTVQLNFRDGVCTACALDTHKMIIITVPYPEGDEGTMYVPIIKLPKAVFVVLSDEGSEITFDFLNSKQVVKKHAGGFLKDPETNFPKEEPVLKIYFNPRLLRDALDSFKDEKEVEMRFIGPLKACVIHGEGKKALVLPVNPIDKTED